MVIGKKTVGGFLATGVIVASLVLYLTSYSSLSSSKPSDYLTPVNDETITDSQSSFHTRNAHVTIITETEKAATKVLKMPAPKKITKLSTKVHVPVKAVKAKPKLHKPILEHYDPYYNEMVLKQIANNESAELPACHIPLLNPWDKQVLPYLKKLFKMQREQGHFKPCNVPKERLLVHLVNRTHVRMNETAIVLFRSRTIADSCKITFFSRKSDKELVWSDPVPLSRGKDFKLPSLEQFAVIFCGKGKIGSSRDIRKFKGYKQVLSRLVETPEIVEKVKKQRKYKKKRLSVLMFYNDGISHLMSRRVLNKTYYYLKNEQKGVALNGQHTVGLNTFPNMIPYLTGHHIKELPSYKGKTFDTLDWPFLWKECDQQDYITGFLEDTDYSTFNYVKKGFRKQPTDYYLKNYRNLVDNAGSCLVTGERTHKNMLSLLEDFLHLHSKNDYFFWWFLNTLSHATFEPVSQADNDYYHFFKEHFEKGTFKNTLLVFAGDHGARFSDIRKTFVGQTEERLPLHLLVFPDWFKSEYSQMYDTLLRNLDALTTPFDMHETLSNIINGFEERLPSNTTRTPKPKRGINLLESLIPLSRTCDAAGIPDKFCICREQTSIAVDSADVVNATITSINHINKLLVDNSLSDVCETAALKNVANAQISNGTVPKTKKRFHDYRIIIETEPGDARYESTVRKVDNSAHMVVVGEIARISLYGNTSHCVTDPMLKNYCYCKQQKAQ